MVVSTLIKLLLACLVYCHPDYLRGVFFSKWEIFALCNVALVFPVFIFFCISYIQDYIYLSGWIKHLKTILDPDEIFMTLKSRCR